LFFGRIKVQLVESKEWLLIVGDRRLVEFSFSNILGQSRAAVKCLLDHVKQKNMGGDNSTFGMRRTHATRLPSPFDKGPSGISHCWEMITTIRTTLENKNEPVYPTFSQSCGVKVLQ